MIEKIKHLKWYQWIGIAVIIFGFVASIAFLLMENYNSFVVSPFIISGGYGIYKMKNKKGA